MVVPVGVFWLVSGLGFIVFTVLVCFSCRFGAGYRSDMGLIFWCPVAVLAGLAFVGFFDWFCCFAACFDCLRGSASLFFAGFMVLDWLVCLYCKDLFH